MTQGHKLTFAALVCLFAVACGVANELQTTTNTPFATPEPTQNVVCLAIRGSVAIRNEEGRVIGWFSKNSPVCVLPGVKQGRLQLADGTANTILAACVYGPTERCK